MSGKTKKNKFQKTVHIFIKILITVLCAFLYSHICQFVIPTTFKSLGAHQIGIVAGIAACVITMPVFFLWRKKGTADNTEKDQQEKGTMPAAMPTAAPTAIIERQQPALAEDDGETKRILSESEQGQAVILCNQSKALSRQPKALYKHMKPKAKSPWKAAFFVMLALCVACGGLAVYCHKAGYNNGHSVGYRAGYEEGHSAGRSFSSAERQSAYDSGFSRGYAQGEEDGKRHALDKYKDEKDGGTSTNNTNSGESFADRWMAAHPQ